MLYIWVETVSLNAQNETELISLVAQLSQRDHAAEWVSYGQTIFYEHYRFVVNHCDVIDQQSNRIRRKNAKWGLLRRSRSFKVIEVGINWELVCDSLLVINSNRHPVSYHFGVIAAYCSNFGHWVFESPFAGLRDNVQCSSWAHWKCIVYFLLVLVELLARCYGWGAMSEDMCFLVLEFLVTSNMFVLI